MGNNKKGAQTPPKAPQTKVENKDGVKVLDMTKFEESMKSPSTGGLDENHQVDLMKIMHETFRQDKNAAERYHMSPETVEKINCITAIGQIAILAQEVVSQKTPFAITMAKSQLDAVLELGASVGITINQKMLPASTGSEEVVEVPSTAISVDSKAKEEIKKEIEAAAKTVEIDPTKIESIEQLRDTILHLFTTVANNYEKFATVMPLYRAWHKIQAGEDQKAIEAINEKTDIQILNEITELIGKCPFTLNGMGSFMTTLTSTYKNPTPAFCMFRNATRNRKTGSYALTDSEIAAYVRTIILWSAKNRAEEKKALIESTKKNIEALSADKDANKEAIEKETAKIAELESQVKYMENDITEYVNNPSSEFADNLIQNMKDKDTFALRAFGIIVNSYIDFGDYREYNQEDIRHNIQQYAGIVTNLFRDPMSALENYSEANLVDPRPIKSEEKPAEEEGSKK